MADRALFLNARDRRYAVERLGLDDERCREVRNGIPESLSADVDVAAEPAAFVVVQVGSFTTGKGAEFTVAAMNEFMRRHDDAELVLLGSGESRERVQRRFLPEVRRRVDVVEAYDRSRLPELLRRGVVKLLPSVSEGQSLALLEAMACGLAPVTTAAGSSFGLVRDGVNGLLVAPRDAVSIVAALERLYAGPRDLQRMRLAARASVRGRTWSAIAAHTETLYAEVLDSSLG
jgi:glycosyltransferase involved in cell wall biosynthesis